MLSVACLALLDGTLVKSMLRPWVVHFVLGGSSGKVFIPRGGTGIVA